MPATLDEAAAIALSLPQTADSVGGHGGNRRFAVEGKTFAWERPFTKADIKRFGTETPPDGPIFAVRTEDLIEKEAVLAEGKKGFFTTPHFDGYAAVLIQLKAVSKRDLRAAIVDAWLAMAPAKLAKDYLRR